VAEKSLNALAVLTFLLVLRQIYVYLFQYKVSCSLDMRVHILILCLLNSAYVFVHYSLESASIKSETFFIFEISQFTIFYMICYYYCQKASSLLPRRQVYIFTIRILFVIGITTILTVGLIILSKIHVFNTDRSDPNGIDPSMLCQNYMFWVFRVTPFLFVIVFSIAYFKIRANISRQRAMSSFDMVAQRRQQETLSKMRLIINLFFVIYFLIFLNGVLVNLAYRSSSEEDNDGDCNQNLFAHNYVSLNAIQYLLLRIFSCLAATWSCLFLFRKRNRPSTRRDGAVSKGSDVVD
jgi:hypothetical protein